MRARTAARAWVRRTGQKLTAMCQVPRHEVDTGAVEATLGEFRARVEKLDFTQEEVELLMTADEMEADIEAASNFRTETVDPALSIAREVLSGVNPEHADRDDVVSSTKSTTEAKLPRIELPKFCGDVKTWTEFWEQFEAVVDVSDLPVITKFTYLRSLLGGEAKATIAGLALTSANYTSAVELLKGRYGRTDRLVFAHIQDLLAVEVPAQPDVRNLWEVYNALQAHVRSLEALGITGEQYGVILTPLILSRLPQDLRMEWARDGETREADLDFLMRFLEKEIARRERSQTYTGATGQLDTRMPGPTATTSALHSATVSNKPFCGACGKTGHWLVDCFVLKKTPVGERKDKVKETGACFRCLKTLPGHFARNCSAKCSKCNGKHHKFLCTTPTCTTPAQLQNNPSPSPNEGDKETLIQSHVTTSNSASHADVLLQTLTVSVWGKRGRVQAVVLFDTGADKSYVSQELVDRVGPEWLESESLRYSSFGTDSVTSTEERDVYSMLLEGDGGKMNVKATCIPKICAPVSQPKVPTSILPSLPGCMSIPAGEKIKIDLLIGLDQYWKIMQGEIRFLSPQLVAQKSRVGWVLSGCVPSKKSGNGGQVSNQLLCLKVADTGLRKTMECSWNISDNARRGLGSSREVKAEQERTTPRNRGIICPHPIHEERRRQPYMKRERYKQQDVEKRLGRKGLRLEQERRKLRKMKTDSEGKMMETEPRKWNADRLQIEREKGHFRREQQRVLQDRHSSRYDARSTGKRTHQWLQTEGSPGRYERYAWCFDHRDQEGPFRRKNIF